MRLFSPHTAVIAIILGWLVFPGSHAEAVSFADIRNAARDTTQGFFDTTAGVSGAARSALTNIRSSVDVGQVAVGAALDSRLEASANVFDSVSRTVYCSIASFLRIDMCDEKVSAPVAAGKQGGTATFIVGKAPSVTVQQNPVQPSKTLVVQSSLPTYIASVERSGMTEAQVVALIDRRIAAIVPVQNVNNYFQTFTTSGGGGSIGYIQGPSDIGEIRGRLDTLEENTSSMSSSQWTTIGSHIYYSSGNVGIGTTTPSSDLSVDGDFNLTGVFQINGNAGTSGYVLQSTGASTAPQWVATSSLGFAGSQWTTSGSDIYYTAGGVAIGTTSLHTGKLAVNGNIVLTDGNNSIISATSTGSNGNTLTLRGGRSGTLFGGEIALNGASSGLGGGVALTGGNGSSNGGNVQLMAGNVGSHSGATLNLVGANSSGGGNLSLSAGGSSGATGGGVFINGGTGSATGPVIIQGASTGNIGVGTTTPLSARFTIVGAPGTLSPFMISSSTDSISMFAITSTGAISVNNSVGALGSVLVSNGSGSAPTWTATTSLGMSSSQWTTSGSNISFSTGNVGIGTAANSNLRLSIAGDVATDWGSYIGLNGSDTNWRLAGTSTDAMVATSIISGNRISFVYGSADNEGIVFGPNGSTSALELLSTSRAFFRGNVAIGTSTVFSGDVLTVKGDIRLTDYNPNRDEVYIRAGTTTSGSGLNLRLRGGEVVSQTGSEISLQGGGSNNPGSININGGSGIGSMTNGGGVNLNAGSAGSSGNGGANLSMNGGNDSGGGEFSVTSGNTSSGTRGGSLRFNGGSGPCCASLANRGFVLLQEFSHGQVGIGTSTPAATFSVKGSPLLSPFLFSSSSDAVMFTMLKDGSVGIGTAAPARALHVVIATDNPPVRFQDSSGYCEINPTTTTWSCVSDQRLKKDIVDLDPVDMLEKLSRIRAVNFRWNNQTDETIRFGMIAQDVEQYFPEFVTTDEKGYKAVAYGAFTSVLVSSIQELNTRLTTLEESLALAGVQINQLNGPLHNMVLDTITATLGVFNKVQIEDGVELKDKATGQVYCLTIVMGEWSKVQGSCGTNVNVDTGSGSGDEGAGDDTATTTDPVSSEEGEDTDTGTSTDPFVSDEPADEPAAEDGNTDERVTDPVPAESAP